MTRRQFAALIASAAVSKTARAAAAPAFERIDTHMHVHRTVPIFLASMEKAGWKGLSVCVSRSVGPEEELPPPLADQLRETPKLARESKGRIAWAASFDSRGWESSDFSERVIADLQRHFENGAIGVKIWKNIGMALRSKTGQYLLPDNPVYTPIFEAVQKADKTLLTHLAEPDGAWQPLDEKNALAGYLKGNPRWHMLNQPGAPTKEAILAARDRILERHPKLRVIGGHLGSMEEHLPNVAKHLDKYPNFAVDVAWRVPDLMAADRAKVVEFMLKYQDRVIYASDYTFGSGTDEERAWNSFQSSHDQEWNYFAGTDTIKYRDREAQGLGLPEGVLRKIFHDNAVRWLPGMPG